MNNYEYCAAFAADGARGNLGFKVLDFGCGAAKTLQLLVKAGVDAYGCDVFYEGGDVSSLIPSELNDRVRRSEAGHIPFDDATFDLVMSNQVLEHVSDLNQVLSEIARVLKPGGICLSLFPHREVWREGHCNIPFLHRFPKGRLRIYYAAALASMGYFRAGKTRMQWARDFADWLDRWCYYRPYREIAETFSRHLSPPQHLESEWMVARRSEARLAPPWLRSFIAAKAAGLVFVTRKPA